MGNCVQLSRKSYMCECESGWIQDQDAMESPNCMLSASVKCDVSNCENGGYCPSRLKLKTNESEVESCVCPKGFHGRYCEFGGQEVKMHRLSTPSLGITMLL